MTSLVLVKDSDYDDLTCGYMLVETDDYTEQPDIRNAIQHAISKVVEHTCQPTFSDMASAVNSACKAHGWKMSVPPSIEVVF